MVISRPDTQQATQTVQTPNTPTPSEIIEQVEKQKATKIEVIIESPKAVEGAEPLSKPQSLARSLEFKVNENKEESIIIRDSETGKRIREIPANELKMYGSPIGNLLDQMI